MKLKPNIVPHIDIRDGSGSLGSLNTCILSKTFKDPYSGMDKTTDLVTVFDAILTSQGHPAAIFGKISVRKTI